MRQLLALCLLSVLLSAVAAQAGNFAPYPPAEFAEGPTLAPVEVMTLMPFEVDAVCRQNTLSDPNAPHGDRPVIGACVMLASDELGLLEWRDWANADKCIVLIPDNAKGSELDYLLAHEIAHCRGWEIDHPGQVSSQGPR